MTESTSALPERRVRRSQLSLSEIGFGAAPVGNLYRAVSDEDARATLESALGAGVTYFDTAPFYGFGLSERRVGDALRGRPDRVVSTKVGRRLEPLPQHRGMALRDGFQSPLPFTPVFDYSYDGIMRSWEASLHRLGLARINILYVHDIGSLTHGAGHAETFGALTRGGGFRALEKLRADGAIDAFGLGVNEWQVCLEAMDHAEMDIILLAGRYTLLDQSALDAFLPACVQRGIAVVVGGAYNSGILATGTRSSNAAYYDYAPAAQHIVDRVKSMEAICDAYKVPLAAAALQFPLAHPAVVSVIPGLDGAQRVQQTIGLHQTVIPPDLWQGLRSSGLLRPDAPVPSETQ